MFYHSRRSLLVSNLVKNLLSNRSSHALCIKYRPVQTRNHQLDKAKSVDIKRPIPIGSANYQVCKLFTATAIILIVFVF